MTDTLLGSRITGGNTAYKRCEADYYPTPPEVTESLLNYLEYCIKKNDKRNLIT